MKESLKPGKGSKDPNLRFTCSRTTTSTRLAQAAQLNHRVSRIAASIIALLLAITSALAFSNDEPRGEARHQTQAKSAAKTTAMESIPVADLPPEALLTLKLLQAGGPFPHRKDGMIFGNREGRLPVRSRGYYREYTVATPRARGRAARRIIRGANNEYYYTDDHYHSFKQIMDSL